MTLIDGCISLKMIKKNLVVLGILDMRQLLLNLTFTHHSKQGFKSIFILTSFWQLLRDLCTV